MPATITSYTTFNAGTKARATQVNANFSNYRGTCLPIETNTATATDNSYDIGTNEHRWRTGYFGTSFFVGDTTTNDLFTVNDTTISYYIGGAAKLLVNNDGIDGAYLKSGSVDTVSIADSAVETDKINDSAVTTDKLNNLSVSTGKIQDAAVAVGKIDDNAVGSANLITGAVDSRAISLDIAAGNLGSTNVNLSVGTTNWYGLYKITTTAPASIAGTTGAQTGQLLGIAKVGGANTLTIINASASGTQKIYTPGGANVVLTTDQEMLWMVFDGTVWRTVG